MFRGVCMLILLPLCVLGQADWLFSTPSKSLFPTEQRIWGETHASTLLPATKGASNAVIQMATTPGPYMPSDATSQPSITTEPTNSTTPPTTDPTNSTTPPTTDPTNSTTPPTTDPTNSTTTPTTDPTNSTTTPTTDPTNSTTTPTTDPTNSTTTPTTDPTNSTTTPTTDPTNSTTATTPGPTAPPMPKVGDYVVRAKWNSSACLMARMGLQFSFRMGESFQTVNLDPNPNVTLTSGTCGNNNGSDSALMLISDKMTVQFIFTNEKSKFFLSALNLTVITESGPTFTAVNSNLSLWEASLGSSYMCKKEQSFNITDALILNTFELQVQPFGLANDTFSTAHECSVDDTSLLIPIIVGAALAVLILIVVIAYVIGRRKTYVGYQTL